MDLVTQQFVQHGHKLNTSDWSAWFCAYNYAKEHKPEVLSMIDKGCVYAEQQKHVPTKYLKVAETLYNEALDK